MPEIKKKRRQHSVMQATFIISVIINVILLTLIGSVIYVPYFLIKNSIRMILHGAGYQVFTVEEKIEMELFDDRDPLTRYYWEDSEKSPTQSITNNNCLYEDDDNVIEMERCVSKKTYDEDVEVTLENANDILDSIINGSDEVVCYTPTVYKETKRKKRG